MSDREVTSKQSSSVRERTGYDEVYPSGCELEEDVPWSPKREPSAHSPTEEEEEDEEDKEGRRMRKMNMMREMRRTRERELTRKIDLTESRL